MKLSKLRAHLEVAKVYSQLSKAKRLKVGAVLVKDNRIISVGYNGTPSGYDNNCEIEVKGELITKPEVVHAETNVVAFAAKNGMSTDNTTLVITDSPCFDCCKLLVQSGIKSVYYLKEYRDISGLEFLDKCGVEVRRFK